MSVKGLGGRLVAAVRDGDGDAVRGLLDAGADPDTRTEDGLPVLCLSVAGHDPAVAEALVEAGGDPDRPLPDGTTPLWRAVDGGSPAVVAAVLGKEPRLRLPAPDRERLLALARHWYEAGAAAELRRRTGARGPAVTERVVDDTYDWVDQVTLGGRTVRAGHGAILTSLEWAFRMLTPVDELVARAVRTPDEEHVDWSAACWTLVERPSDETRSAVVAHRHRPEAVHRRFVADYVWRKSFAVTSSSRHREQDGELLIAWAEEETDSSLLATVLRALTEYDHPGQAAVGLRHAGHPDPRVRREVPYAFLTKDGLRSPAAKQTVRALMRDPDPEVRCRACEVGVHDDACLPEVTRALLLLVEHPDDSVRRPAAGQLAAFPVHSPAVTDALMALLDADDRLTRLEGAWGLARRDDPRTEEAYERVGDLGPGHEEDHRLLELLRWRWRRRDAPDAGAPTA